MIDASILNGGPSAARVTGVTSQAIVRLLSDRGVPANELVVTSAERNDDSDGANWTITVLRGRSQATYALPLDLVDKVLARGPDEEWYGEVGRMLEAAGMAFPA